MYHHCNSAPMPIVEESTTTTAPDSTPAAMSLSTASSIFPPQARYSPPSDPYDSGGLGSYTFPYSRTVGYAEAWGFSTYPSSTPGFLPPPEQPHQQQQQPLHAMLPPSSSITAPYFAQTEDISMYDAASVVPPPAHYNPPYVPPADLMTWSSSHQGGAAFDEEQQQQSAAFPMTFPPRRLNPVPDEIVVSGPLPQANYSFGTGGRRALPASAHPNARTPSGNTDVSGHVQRAGTTGVLTPVAADNHPGGEDKASPGGTSNKTTTPVQTTPKQLSPRNEQPDSPLSLRSAPIGPAATTIPTPNAPYEAPGVPDDIAGAPSARSGDSTMSVSDAARLAAHRRDAETAPSSTPSSSPAQSRPTLISRVMPHPLAPLLPSSSSSFSLPHGPPSASSTHSSTPSQYPLPSPALDHPSVSTALSSRFGSIDSGRISLFSGISSGAEAESISSVPASFASDSCGSLIEDNGVGGVFERDVQSLSSDPRIRIALATSPVTRLQQQHTRSSTTGTGSAISVSPTCTTGSSTAAPSTMLPPPLSYSLDSRRASCPALLDSSGDVASLPQSVTGATSTLQGEGTSSSSASPETSTGASWSSREPRERPPVPTPEWDHSLPSAVRRAAPSFSTSSSFTVRDEASAGPSTPSSSPGAPRSTVFPSSAQAGPNHAPKRVSSVPVLTRGSLSTVSSPVSRPPVTAGSTPSSSSPAALNLGPAYEKVPGWERVAPPHINLFHSTAGLAAFASASVSNAKDTSSPSDEMYREALVPIGESPSSTSGGSVSTPFTTTPATTVEWTYDHPTIFVRSPWD